MSDYLSLTELDKQAMLDSIGIKSIEELFEDVPSTLRTGELNLPKGKSQQETFEILRGLSRRNRTYDSIFIGAGSYNHFIPSVVKAICSRSEFVTAYTPYQAEMSQGILQAIFEYQTMICNLTVMDVSNASHYSGATAAAEACIMCSDKVKRVVTFDNIHPDVLQVFKTYFSVRGILLDVIPSVDGKAVLPENIGAVGAVYIQSPNFYGLIEDSSKVADICHTNGGKFIIGCNPVSLALLKSPRELGADVAVGEAQPFGLPMNYGGPYVGFLATTAKEMRRISGRIVGETVDKDGNKAYVLTLQAREQHIRRERATSNICSNEAHCALTVSVYLSAVGAQGLREVALACASNAHYLANGLVEVGAKLAYQGEFFHEFVTVVKGKTKEILSALEKENILGGLMLDDDRILWCCTEMVNKTQMDKVIKIVGGVL